MIKFETGSSRFDFDADVFHLDADVDGRAVRCGVSVEAIEQLTHGEFSGEDGQTLGEWERTVFDLLARKYEREGLNDLGALTLGEMDVVRLMAH